MDRIVNIGLETEEIRTIDSLVLEGKVKPEMFQEFADDVRLAEKLIKRHSALNYQGIS